MRVDGRFSVHNILGWKEIEEIKGNIFVIYCHNFKVEKRIIDFYEAPPASELEFKAPLLLLRVVIFVKVKSHCGDVFQV